jgi:tight adherence protein C
MNGNINIIDLIIAISAGGAVVCFSLYVFEHLSKINIDHTQQKDKNIKELPLLFKICLPFASNTGGIVNRPFFDSYKKSINEKLIMSGYEEVLSAQKFLSISIIINILNIVLFFFIFLTAGTMPALLLGALLAAYPFLWLKKVVKVRHWAIQKALPNVIDLLTLSVEAGKDFLTSLRDILARRKRDALGEELERTFREIQLGKKRTDALKDLVKRVQLADLTSVINSIIQADEMGVSIANILRIQGDQLRMKRFNRAEKMANETPVKIILPIAIFIVPAVFIIVTAPFIMQVLSVLMNK